MTEKLEFLRDGEGAILVRWDGGSRRLLGLDELHGLELPRALDVDSARRFGVVVTLLAVRELRRAGTEPSWGNIMRTFDEFDLVFDEEPVEQAFEGGIEEAVDCVRSAGSDAEAELWELV